jgi:hypothetical protein
VIATVSTGTVAAIGIAGLMIAILILWAVFPLLRGGGRRL